MRIHEYRVVLPCAPDEYYRAQLYMVAKASREETGKMVGEGIEVVKNEPYQTNAFGMPPGQYTEKIFHLKSQIPKWIAAVLPTSMLQLYEYSWNAFPKCMTVYENRYLGEKFHMSVETMHLPDRGETENANNLSPEELKKRVVEVLDVSQPLDVKFEDGYVPAQFKSELANRGPFVPGYFRTAVPVMCCYKVVRLRVKVLIQAKIEKWGQHYGMRNPFVMFHRKLVCWMDEWLQLSLEDIRQYEIETARIVKEKLARRPSGSAGSGRLSQRASRHSSVLAKT